MESPTILPRQTVSRAAHPTLGEGTLIHDHGPAWFKSDSGTVLALSRVEMGGFGVDGSYDWAYPAGGGAPIKMDTTKRDRGVRWDRVVAKLMGPGWLGMGAGFHWTFEPDHGAPIEFDGGAIWTGLPDDGVRHDRGVPTPPGHEHWTTIDIGQGMTFVYERETGEERARPAFKRPVGVPDGHRVFRVEWTRTLACSVMAKDEKEARSAAERAAEEEDIDDWGGDGWEVTALDEVNEEPDNAVHDGDILDMHDWKQKRLEAGVVPYVCSDVVPDWMRAAVEAHKFGVGREIRGVRTVDGQLWITDGTAALSTGDHGVETWEAFPDDLLSRPGVPASTGQRYPCDYVAGGELVSIGETCAAGGLVDLVAALYGVTEWTTGHHALDPTHALVDGKVVALIMPCRR